MITQPAPVYLVGGKDYIPGPGEYEVNPDDTGRHKRYGFLNQTNRFQEDQQQQLFGMIHS